jgi:cell division protein FtsN
MLADANQTSGAPIAAVNATPAVSGGNAVEPDFVQIGAYPSREFAEKAFRQFKLTHGELAGDYLPDIKKADLGARGVWYRLRLGPFPGKPAAAAACEEMKKEGVTCLIAER